MPCSSHTSHHSLGGGWVCVRNAVHAHFPSFGDQIVLFLVIDDAAPVPFENQIRSPQPQVSAIQPVVAVLHANLTHAEAERHFIQGLGVLGESHVGEIERAFFVRPRLEAGHRHFDHKVLAGERIRSRAPVCADAWPPPIIAPWGQGLTSARICRSLNRCGPIGVTRILTRLPARSGIASTHFM